MFIGRLKISVCFSHLWQKKKFLIKKNKFGVWVKKNIVFAEKKDFTPQITLGLSIILVGLEINLSYGARK
jgi:hypothetical protein